jgi:hypothetical protein
MTSEQDMTMLRRPWRWIALATVWFACAVGCESTEPLSDPHHHASPYPATKLWAVAPFANESGFSAVDGMAFADRLTQQLQQVRNLDVLPVNRVLEAMRARRMADVRSVEQAMALLETLGVDGLLVGTITAWDPYTPPKIGATVQLISRRSGAMNVEDTRRLSSASTDVALPGLTRHAQPVARASWHFDAANHRVLADLQTYAQGRVPPDSPAGWRRYLNSMDLFSEFVSHELMRMIFAAEWDRLTVPATQASQTAAPSGQAPR